MSNIGKKIEWQDFGREPQCAPDPKFPDGIDVIDPMIGRAGTSGKSTCKVDLPYPAKRCGVHLVYCEVCDQRVALTTAGRRDDPRSLTMLCKSLGTKH